MEEHRKQIKAEETGDKGCANCQTTAAHFKCGRCHVVPYCSRDCQLSHLSAHRATCDQSVQALSNADSKYLVQKDSTTVQRKSQKWFNKERISIALLARALIPSGEYLSQVLYLEVNDCLDCHRGTCRCERSTPPPGGFHICAASIKLRQPEGEDPLSVGIEALIKQGWGFSEKGRLVAVGNAKNNALLVQWCFTDSCEESKYTATQLLRVINRDAKYACPEMNRLFTPLVPPCGVMITYPTKGDLMDTNPYAADIQDMMDFGYSMPVRTQTPEERASYALQFEQLKARVHVADPAVRTEIVMVQRVVEETEHLYRSGDEGGKCGQKRGEMRGIGGGNCAPG
ncbi:hypothetical protein B484DRAFT_448020 [Ochromonadaceae sp. CCMP2298]|nr:hypothetical protein B484DRAFT_448020 [Ochromonadaceae sp. CCMP2298]